ncbi:MAG: glycoside hydrolase, partial [Chlorobi bacterium]|nr:glycoside hydrolase [Chlorobiota bacterium]
MKHKFRFLLLCAVFLSGGIYSQDVPDWVWKSPMTKVYPWGEYQNLPPATDQFTYQNPNTTTRYVNEGGQTFVLPPNFRPFPHSNNQSEVDAANMGGNTQVIYASWNSFVPVFSGTGFCLSTNGGASWTGNSVMIPYPTCQGDPGPWVYPTGSTWAGRLGISYIAGAGYSSDNGATWTGHVPYTGGSSFDKNLSAVDDISGSPFFGRAYTVWTYFSTNRIYISYTTNGGASWSGGVPVSPVPPGGHHHQGCDVEVGPGGVVHVIWANCLTSGQNSTEDFLGYARSTDGGVSWVGVTDNAVDINGI